MLHILLIDLLFEWLGCIGLLVIDDINGNIYRLLVIKCGLSWYYFDIF